MFKSNTDIAAVHQISQEGAVEYRLSPVDELIQGGASSQERSESNRNHAALPGEYPYHNGAVLSGAVINDILDRLDKASQVARRIGARQQKLDGKHGSKYRAPTHRLAGLIQGIYNTLAREHGEAQYVHDVREELIPKIRRGH
jgi:hypothetical protein